MSTKISTKTIDCEESTSGKHELWVNSTLNGKPLNSTMVFAFASSRNMRDAQAAIDDDLDRQGY